MCDRERRRSVAVMFTPAIGAGDPIIVADNLTKRYGARTVVDELSFEIGAGRVTGFLGPNGAGKTQTIKMILGLVAPSEGQARIAGRPLIAHRHPSGVVGAVLDGGAFHPSCTGRATLRIAALLAGVPSGRADALLERVALAEAADEKVGAYSLGMRQRLALTQGMLADPAVLIADEPSNGLDPGGSPGCGGCCVSSPTAARPSCTQATCCPKPNGSLTTSSCSPQVACGPRVHSPLSPPAASASSSSSWRSPAPRRFAIYARSDPCRADQAA